MLSMLLRIFSLVFVVWLLRRFLAAILGNPKRAGMGHNPLKSRQEMVKDPICGMYMDSRLAVRLENHNEVFYFCSEDCKNRFLSKSPGAGAASGSPG